MTNNRTYHTKKKGGAKQETVNMDVRIGVVQHTLLQAKLKDKSDMQRDAYNWSAGLASSQDAYYH